MRSGPIRPFAGGGMSFRSTFKETTSVFDAGVPTSTLLFKLEPVVGTPVPYYITGRLESRLSFLSIRPELRYTLWTSFDARSSSGRFLMDDQTRVAKFVVAIAGCCCVEQSTSQRRFV